MTIQRNWRPKAEPHLPLDYDDDVVLAVRALWVGDANKQQQLLVRDYLMYATKASDEFQDLSYRPGDQGTRATDFAEGSKFVGLGFRKMLRPELTPIGKVAAPLKPAERVRAARQKKLKSPGEN